MDNFASTLKAEIGRLARKEIRRELATLKRIAARQRKEIAALKKMDKSAATRITELEKAFLMLGARQPPLPTPTGRFSAGAMKKHRQRLGLSAWEYGKLLGTTGKTIYTWEHGSAWPRGKRLARFFEIRALGKRAALARLAEIKEGA